jgi:hypothetical protein
VAVLEWVANNWFWAVGGYALAFSVLVVVGTCSYVRDERAKCRTNLERAVSRSDVGADKRADSFPFGVSYTAADSDGDTDSAAGSGSVSGRHAGLRSIQRVHGDGGSGRHVLSGDPVCADAEAVA